MKAKAAILIFSFLLQFASVPAFSSSVRADSLSFYAHENFGICIPDLPVEDSESLFPKFILNHFFVGSHFPVWAVYKSILTALPPLVFTIEIPRHIQLRVLRN